MIPSLHLRVLLYHFISKIIINRKTIYTNQDVYICLAERIDSSSFKRFTATLDNILESLEDVDLTAAG